MMRQTCVAILLVLAICPTALFLFSDIVYAKPMPVIFDVNDTSDLVDNNLADGICYTIGGTCTLRAAIMQANVLGGMNTINVPGGVYTLTLGELVIQSDVVINGAGTSLTIVNGNQIGRVFHVSDGTSPLISKLTIQNGNALCGGGVANSGTLWLSDTVIISNSVTACGGGIDNAGTMRITDSTIADNVANGVNAICGGILNRGYLEIANTTVINNKAKTGGGICNSGIGDLQILTIAGNTAEYGAGIFNAHTGQLSVHSSLIWKNIAQVAGGGITSGGQLFLSNVTISDNVAQLAGGGVDNGGLARIVNVTLAGNALTHTLGVGENLYSSYNPTSSIQVANTIIAKGSQRGNCAVGVGNGIISLGHNLSDDDTCNLNASGDVTNTNPWIGPLQNNGGATFTHALLPPSPAINAGNNRYCPLFDQRGVPRPQADICDIGAYEFVFPFTLYLPIIRR